MFEDCFPFFQAMQGDSASDLNLDLQVSHKAVNNLLQRIKKIYYFQHRSAGNETTLYWRG